MARAARRRRPSSRHCDEPRLPSPARARSGPGCARTSRSYRSAEPFVSTKVERLEKWKSRRFHFSTFPLFHFLPLSSTLSVPQSVDHATGLVERLAVLLLRVRIGHDAAAGAEVHAIAARRRDNRPDRNARVERAGDAVVANRPAVHAALRRLELRDDFHGPDLRRS